MDESCDEERAANKAKTAFLANMSHEIRTPLNAILGFAQLIDRDTSLSAGSREKLGLLIRSGEHLLEIVNDILEMSRIESGRIELNPESFNISEFMENLQSMFSMRAKEKGLAFESVLQRGLPGYARTDRGKLLQVLSNLLGNAIKFTRFGSVTLRASSPSSGTLVFEVEDSGIGIAEAELDQIFLPFIRGRKSEETTSGTGLGLAISREYAHLLGGEISATSQVGRGSLFRLEIQAELSEQSLAPNHKRKHYSLAPDQGSLTALVVDDARSNRILLGEMLKEMGFRVIEAEEGSAAVEMAKVQEPKIVLMDLLMPGMDGYDATIALRKLYPPESMTIIGVSASVFDVDKRHFMEAGLSGFLPKPFKEEDLIEAFTKLGSLRFAEVKADSAISPMDPKERSRRFRAMAPAWQGSWKATLSQGDIKGLRVLALEAASSDRALSEWMSAEVEAYDLRALKQLEEG